MFDIVYSNGCYGPRHRAHIGIDDRGFQFADSVYELIALYRGQLLSFDAHIDRLWRSLDALHLRSPLTRKALTMVIGETIRRNRVQDALVYIQISRGSAVRAHVPTDHAMAPSLVVSLYPPIDNVDDLADKGVAVVTTPDIRWKRCSIKSTALIANVLAKCFAAEKQSFEAWYIDGSTISEGATSNAWIVDDRNHLHTCPDEGRILPGVTRSSILALAERMNIPCHLEAFSPDAVKNAREAFLSSASCFILPVVTVDGHRIGDGRPGKVTRRLREAYKKNGHGPRMHHLWAKGYERTENGFSENGGTENGPTENGFSENGPTENGGTENEFSENGGADINGDGGDGMGRAQK